MLSYQVAIKNPAQYTLEVQLSFVAAVDNPTIRMPHWRPGRYESGNFVRNVVGLEVRAESGGEVWKSEPEQWTIKAKIGERIHVSYDLFSNDLTAGNTYADEDLFLLNPVNALVYPEGMDDADVELKLELPDNWKVCTSMSEQSPGMFSCAGVQKLMDTPFLAGPSIETLTYRVDDIPYYIHVYGEIAFDRDKVLADFEGFTRAQVKAFGSLPVDQYHFLIIMTPHRSYHGVEHEASTVITLGKADEFNERPRYKELIGISSHELYHTWNVKDLRPKDWTPYDLTGPDYSRLGYVAEGVTTYMGDFMLWQGGAFSDQDFLQELSTLVRRHMDNEGMFNLSLADSSIDTWVDGYGVGTPRRRVSIYVEGALLALVCDIWLMKESNGKRSLNEVMKEMFEKYGSQKGYTESEYWEAMSAGSDLDWDGLKADVVDGKGKLIDIVSDALTWVGLEIEAFSKHTWESKFGFSVVLQDEQCRVVNVLEGSPAYQAGLVHGNIIEKVGGQEPKEIFEQGGEMDDELSLDVKSGFRERYLFLKADGETWLQDYKVDHASEPTPHFESWKTVLKSFDANSEITANK